MSGLNFPKPRFRIPSEPGVKRPPRRAAYVLPTLFTSGNLFLGFLAILKTFEGVMAAGNANGASNADFAAAAKAIGVSVMLDGIDGRIARMTNTVSDFGREMDSLADVITFGIAPAVLAYAWGVEFVVPGGFLHDHRAGYFIAFLFLLCGAARLARFNVQTNPKPKNPGRPDRKYFVGLPIPAGAAAVAAVVYAADCVPLQWWPLSAAWLGLLALLSFLMVSTWRYPSFKDLNLLQPRSPLILVLLGSFVYLIWNFGQTVLLLMATAYVLSGIVLRAGGILRRRFSRRAALRETPAEPTPEPPLG